MSIKLPHNIEIQLQTIIKTEIKQVDNGTYVYAYLTMTEVTQIDLIKANAIPLKMKTNIYWIYGTSANIVAIDYDN